MKELEANNVDWLFASALNQAPSSTHMLKYLREGKHTTQDKKSFVIHFWDYYMDGVEQGCVKFAESNIRSTEKLKLEKGSKFQVYPTALGKLKLVPYSSLPKVEEDELDASN